MSGETSLKGLDIAFYGHFTGDSSYPIVCRELAHWLVGKGANPKLINLRRQEIQGDLLKYQVSSSEKSRIGMLFGFPSWYAELPRHEVMIGYHVGDVSPIPAGWISSIQSHCSMILTPSEWCRGLLATDERTSLGGIPIHVVPHGVSEAMMSPVSACGELARSLRIGHFSSSVTNERKGTVDLLRSASRVLERKLSSNVMLQVSVHPSAFAEAVSYMRDFDHGSIRVQVDMPGSHSLMGATLRGLDLVAQPSRAEGFGLIPLEAAACGVPSLMTACTGHGQYVDDLLGGVVVVPDGELGPCAGGYAPTLDPDDLDVALGRAIEDVEALRAKAMIRAEEVRKKWAWGAVLDRHLLHLLAPLCA